MRPAVLVTRTTFPDIEARLHEHFDVADNQSDILLSLAELLDRLQGEQDVMSTGGAADWIIDWLRRNIAEKQGVV